jgi:hypothetical protein
VRQDEDGRFVQVIDRELLCLKVAVLGVTPCLSSSARANLDFLA